MLACFFPGGHFYCQEDRGQEFPPCRPAKPSGRGRGLLSGKAAFWGDRLCGRSCATPQLFAAKTCRELFAPSPLQIATRARRRGGQERRYRRQLDETRSRRLRAEPGRLRHRMAEHLRVREFACVEVVRRCLGAVSAREDRSCDRIERRRHRTVVSSKSSAPAHRRRRSRGAPLFAGGP